MHWDALNAGKIYDFLFSPLKSLTMRAPLEHLYGLLLKSSRFAQSFCHSLIWSQLKLTSSSPYKMNPQKTLLTAICFLAIYNEVTGRCPNDWSEFNGKCYILKGPFLRRDAMNECKVNLKATVMKPPIDTDGDEILAKLNARMGVWLDVKRNRTDLIYRWDGGQGDKVMIKEGKPLKSRSNKCVKYRKRTLKINFRKVDCSGKMGWVVCVIQ